MSESMKEDLKDHRVPNCIYWTIEDVCAWIEGIGFPDYKVGVFSLLSQPKFCYVKVLGSIPRPIALCEHCLMLFARA